MREKSNKESEKASKSFSGNWFRSISAVIAKLLVLGAAIKLIGKAVKNMQIQARAMFQIEQAVKQTGQAAGFTAKELGAMARQLQEITGIGDELILSNVTNQLLTFTNIVGENFNRAQKAVLDLNAVIQKGEVGSLSAQAIQLAKALENPIQGINAMSRSGITFTEIQKETIKGLVDQNKLFEAQTIILDEVNAKYGGQAEALANAEGGLKQFTARMGDLTEEVGGLVIPILVRAADAVEFFLKKLNIIKTDVETIDASQLIRDLENAGASAEVIRKTQETYIALIADEITERSKTLGVINSIEDAQNKLNELQESVNDATKEQLKAKSDALAATKSEKKFHNDELLVRKGVVEHYKNQVVEVKKVIDLFKEQSKAIDKLKGKEIEVKVTERALSEEELKKQLELRTKLLEDYYSVVGKKDKNYRAFLIKQLNLELTEYKKIRNLEIDLDDFKAQKIKQIDQELVNDRTKIQKEYYDIVGIEDSNYRDFLVLQMKQELAEFAKLTTDKALLKKLENAKLKELDKKLYEESQQLITKYYDTVGSQDSNYRAFLVDNLNHELEELKKSSSNEIDLNKFKAEKLKEIDEKVNAKSLESRQKFYDTVGVLDQGYRDFLIEQMNKEIAEIQKNTDEEINIALLKQQRLKEIDEQIAEDERAIREEESFLGQAAKEISELNEIEFTAFDAISQGFDRLATSTGSLERGFSTMATVFVMSIKKMLIQALALKALKFLLNLIPGAGTFLSAGIPTAKTGGSFEVSSRGPVSVPLKAAQGVSFEVPRGFPNDTFPILAQSGERVNIETQSQSQQSDLLNNKILNSIQALNKNMVKMGVPGNEISITQSIEGRDLQLLVEESEISNRRIRGTN
jgi:hypothetical protein